VADETLPWLTEDDVALNMDEIVVEDEEFVDTDELDSDEGEGDVGWMDDEQREWWGWRQMMVNTEQTYQFDEISLSPVSQNVTSTKLNLFGPAISEHSMRSLKKQLVTSLDKHMLQFSV